MQLRNIDAHLSETEKADCEAYSALLLGVLADVEAWVFWVDPVHYDEVVWPLISRTLLTPLRWVLPGILRRRHAAALAQSGWGDVHVLKNAAQAAYSAIGTRLASSSGPFLFGNRITSADALLYGHLATVRHALPGQWAAAEPSLLRTYESICNALFETQPGDASPNATLRGTSGATNLFDALDRAIDARRLRNATTVHSRHAFARTTNAEVIQPASVGGATAAAEAALQVAQSVTGSDADTRAASSPASTWWWAVSPPWRRLQRERGGGDASVLELQRTLDASGVTLGDTSTSGPAAASQHDSQPLSVQRWGFAADRRMLARAVGAVQRAADGGPGVAVARDLFLASVMVAITVVAVRTVASAQR